MIALNLFGLASDLLSENRQRATSDLDCGGEEAFFARDSRSRRCRLRAFKETDQR